MSPQEQYFAFSFVSVFSVAILATWFRYLPTLIKLYRTVATHNQMGEEKYSFKG